MSRVSNELLVTLSLFVVFMFIAVVAIFYEQYIVLMCFGSGAIITLILMVSLIKGISVVRDERKS